MTNIRTRIFAVLFLLLLSLSKSTVLGKVRVRIINKLGHNRALNMRCQSRDDDLGYVIVPDGHEFGWKFSVNFWGTTCFYCDVQWERSTWHHFDAYSYKWDSVRCQTECTWKISEDGLLYGYSQEFQQWELMPFQDG